MLRHWRVTRFLLLSQISLETKLGNEKSEHRKAKRMLVRWLSEQSACHTTQASIANVCNLTAIRQRWKAKTEELPSAHRPSSPMYTAVNTRQQESLTRWLKTKAEDQNLPMGTVAHTCLQPPTRTHTHTCTHELRCTR